MNTTDRTSQKVRPVGTIIPEALKDAVNEFVSQHWPDGVIPWPLCAEVQVGAAVILFDDSEAYCPDTFRANGYAKLMRQWVDEHVPVVLLHQAAQPDRPFADLSASHPQVMYATFRQHGWYTLVFHALKSILACRQHDQPMHIVLTLGEKQRLRSTHLPIVSD